MRKTEIFVILGSFLSFHPPDNAENQNFKIVKNIWRYYHLTHLHHKWQSYDAWFLRYGARQTEFVVILDCFFALLPSYGPRKLISWENKNKSEDIIILQMCAIYGSHMMYGYGDMECNRNFFFGILDQCLSFYFANNPKNQNFKNMKKNTWWYYHFTQVYNKWQSCDVWFLRYRAQQTEFFCHYLSLTIIWPFTPLTT